MANNKKYDKLSEQVVELIGGKSNVSYFTHCVTRLRFNIKDKGLVRFHDIENLEGVVGCYWAGEQLQIIVGPAVADVYKTICTKYSFQQENSIGNKLEEAKKTKISFMSLVDIISSCITPALPIMIGGGMIKVILLVCEMIGILTIDSPTYETLSFVSDSAFYFLPIFVGAASAKKFGLNMWIGMFLGAVLVHPTFVSMCTDGSAGSIFGIPIYSATYASSIFPIILSTYVASRIERLVTKYSPDFLKTMLVPLLTILIMTPLMLCILGPIGAFIGNYLTEIVTWLYDKTGFIGVGIMGAISPWIIITGMHHSFNPYVFQSFAKLGYEPLVLVVTFINNLNQGIACIAVGIKSKDKNIKAMASSCGVTALVCGVTEPALYGVTLKKRTPLYAVMIGNFVGGLVAGIFKAVIYAFAGSWGIFGLPAFIGEHSGNLMYMIISLIIGMIVTFIATLIMYKDRDNN